MSLQTGALEKQSYFPLTQQIWHKAWHAEEGHSLQSLCAKITCIVFPIIFAVATVEGILLAGRKMLQLFTKQNENNASDNVVQPFRATVASSSVPIKVDVQADDSQYEVGDIYNQSDLIQEEPIPQHLIKLHTTMQTAIADKQKRDIEVRQTMENTRKQSKERLEATIAKIAKQRDEFPQGAKERVALDKAIKTFREIHETAHAI